MITTHQTMDPKSLEIRREGVRVGDYQWHSGEAHFVPCRAFCFISLNEMLVMHGEYEKIISKPTNKVEYSL